MNQQFSVIVNLMPQSEEQILDVADSLGAVECLDASVSGHDEGVEVIFNRASDTLDSAIKSAVTSIESAGYHVIRVEMARESLILEG